MILALALGCLTRAAQEQRPQPVAPPPPTYVDLGLPLRVPDELLDPRDVTAVCSADLVFIGTIVDAQSFMGRDRSFDPPLRWPDVILTEATFEVERVIAGTAGPRFKDIFFGGELAGEGRSHWSHNLFPGVGRRYGLAMVRRSYQLKLESNYSGGDWAMNRWIELDPDAPLPSESQLREEYDRICGAKEQ